MGTAQAIQLRTRDRSRDASARLGRTLRGGYWLESVLGVGAMAAVYGALHPARGRVAIKMLHAEHARTLEVRERFEREADIARAMAHPGCVEIFDSFETDEGDLAHVMEHLDGATIDEIWREKARKLPVAFALRIASGVLDVLSACHARGVVHRDVKPANIFLTSSGRVKLLDFGVARYRAQRHNQTRAGLALGTIAFMAPEQARGQVDRVDERSDLYAVGAVLYTLTSGVFLNAAPSRSIGRDPTDEGRPAAPIATVAPHLPADVAGLIDKAVAWSPTDRFQRASHMRLVIDELLAHEIVRLRSTNGARSSCSNEAEISWVREASAITRPNDHEEDVAEVTETQIETACYDLNRSTSLPEPPPEPPPSGVRPCAPVAAATEPPAPAPVPVAPRLPSPSITGQLTQIALPHLLSHALASQVTGTLVFIAPSGDRHVVQLERGGPTKLRTSIRLAPLGEVLSRCGAVGREQLERCAARAKQAGALIGAQLVTDNVLDRPTLAGALRLQATLRVGALSALPVDTKYEFYRDADLIASDRDVESVPIGRLPSILSAVRAWPQRAAIESAFAQRGDACLALHPSATPHRFVLSRDERRIVEALERGPHTLGALLGLGIDADATRRLLYALVLTRHAYIGDSPAGLPLGVDG